jgi:hypothetical protein
VITQVLALLVTDHNTAITLAKLLLLSFSILLDCFNCAGSCPFLFIFLYCYCTSNYCTKYIGSCTAIAVNKPAKKAKAKSCNLELTGTFNQRKSAGKLLDKLTNQKRMFEKRNEMGLCTLCEVGFKFLMVDSLNDSLAPNCQQPKLS